MKETAKRLEEVLDLLKLNKNAFAREIGVSSTVINGIVSGMHNPGPKVLGAINSRFPEINTDWISNGIGQIQRSEGSTKPTDNESFGNQVIERLLDEFTKLREQLSIKDRQLEAADKRAEGLQRTIDALLNRPLTSTGNFPNDVAAGRSVVRIHPAVQQVGLVA
ncbi:MULTISPECIES: helix-turn-helix domain-containing protein [unclassified Spirosoma]|uniref:helix-turn-helix domain-containing protein n=1 Tax=unclassified Spirosoma TaxID=2621999 RepID=UPI0009620E3F|nr:MULTISPECIES: helix-turn-helix domain-containing protein [unclassified Spirosoma]MBN8820785.1 helix-turn-helix transcriptional regulator [Spirosoma sp.]OJW76379.1 MAG: hypothetical protein BGO59_22935 [Spirosoma sp. 48-14]